MIDMRTLDDLAQRLAALTPGQFDAAQQDLKQAFKATLQSGLARLDLVTREEFDVQRLVLLRTREKLDALERQLGELEAQIRARRN
jgi:BMFP domain-containing protein YqiC